MITQPIEPRTKPVTAAEARELEGEVCIRCGGFGHHEGMRIHAAPGKGSYCPVGCAECGGKGFKHRVSDVQ